MSHHRYNNDTQYNHICNVALIIHRFLDDLRLYKKNTNLRLYGKHYDLVTIRSKINRVSIPSKYFISSELLETALFIGK